MGAEVDQLLVSDPEFLQGDAAGCFHLVVSNPPWLPDKVMKHVSFSREIVSQPIAAFTSGSDGMTAYRELAEKLSAPNVLTDGAWVVLVCQEGAEARVADVFSSAGRYELIEASLRYVVL